MTKFYCSKCGWLISDGYYSSYCSNCAKNQEIERQGKMIEKAIKEGSEAIGGIGDWFSGKGKYEKKGENQNNQEASPVAAIIILIIIITIFSIPALILFSPFLSPLIILLFILSPCLGIFCCFFGFFGVFFNDKKIKTISILVIFCGFLFFCVGAFIYAFGGAIVGVGLACNYIVINGTSICGFSKNFNNTNLNSTLFNIY
jgi:hypothetical protein